MTQFAWLSDSICPPARWDLRYIGWKLRDAEGDGECRIPILLDWRAATRPDDWRAIADKNWTMAIGVDDTGDRATLLAGGLGEVLPSNVGLVEIAERALRLGDNAQRISRYRTAGPVTLDLFHRDGRIERQWLGLHPREFSLLWRLAEEPGKRVTRRELLSDVWRIDHEPETNSVEVHVSRLRSKLAVSRACWLVVTDPDGGYRLAHDGGASFFAYRSSLDPSLDSAATIGNDGTNDVDGEQDADEAQRARIDRTG